MILGYDWGAALTQEFGHLLPSPVSGFCEDEVQLRMLTLGRRRVWRRRVSGIGSRGRRPWVSEHVGEWRSIAIRTS